MTLYFNGCSFTYGDELTYPEKDSWPVLVADALRCDFHNDAISGGTNQRSLYRTILNIDNYDFFIVAWTSYARFTEYNPVDNFEINFLPMAKMDTLHHHNSLDLQKNYFKYTKFSEMYYAYWFNELYAFKQWLQQILLLQAFFRQHGKKYLMLNTMHNNLSSWLQPADRFIDSCKQLIDFFDHANDAQLLEHHKEIRKMESLIDKSKFVGWNDWYLQQLCKTFACGPRGHILEEGHQEVAKKILEHYNINNPT